MEIKNSFKLHDTLEFLKIQQTNNYEGRQQSILKLMHSLNRGEILLDRKCKTFVKLNTKAPSDTFDLLSYEGLLINRHKPNSKQSFISDTMFCCLISVSYYLPLSCFTCFTYSTTRKPKIPNLCWWLLTSESKRQFMFKKNSMMSLFTRWSAPAAIYADSHENMEITVIFVAINAKRGKICASASKRYPSCKSVSSWNSLMFLDFYFLISSQVSWVYIFSQSFTWKITFKIYIIVHEALWIKTNSSPSYLQSIFYFYNTGPKVIRF